MKLYRRGDAVLQDREAAVAGLSVEGLILPGPLEASGS